MEPADFAAERGDDVLDRFVDVVPATTAHRVTLKYYLRVEVIASGSVSP